MFNPLFSFFNCTLIMLTIQIPKIANNNFLLILIILIFSSVFISPFWVANDLYDSTRTGKILFFAQWMLVFIPFGVLIFFRSRKEGLSVISILVILWASWILIRGKQGGIWNDDKFFWFAGCFVFFFLQVQLLLSLNSTKKIFGY